MNLPFDPVTPFLGLYLKEPKTLIQKDISTPMFTEALFAIAKIWKKLKCPSIDEWVKQLWDIYTVEFILLSCKKEENFTLCDHTENIRLSEISQSEKDK